MNKTPIIIDTDIGGDIDDTWALIMLLKMPKYEIKLITILGYDTFYQAKLVAKILSMAGYDHIPIAFNPPLDNNGGPQNTWVGDYNLSDYRGQVHNTTLQPMVDIIQSTREKITILSLAGSTNIAQLINVDPFTPAKCDLVGMKGSIKIGYDALPQPEIETNVKFDILGCKQVLQTFNPQWVMPLDACGQIRLDGSRYQAILKSSDILLRILIENYKVWWGNCAWNEQKQNVHYESSILFDVGAVMLMYKPSLFKIDELSLQIDTDGYTTVDTKGDIQHLCATHIYDEEEMYIEIMKILMYEGGMT